MRTRHRLGRRFGDEVGGSRDQGENDNSGGSGVRSDPLSLKEERREFAEQLGHLMTSMVEEDSSKKNGGRKKRKSIGKKKKVLGAGWSKYTEKLPESEVQLFNERVKINQAPQLVNLMEMVANSKMGIKPLSESDLNGVAPDEMADAFGEANGVELPGSSNDKIMENLIKDVYPVLQIKASGLQGIDPDPEAKEIIKMMPEMENR